jgi:hypothetical protein
LGVGERMKKLAAAWLGMGGLWLSIAGCSSSDAEPERVPAAEFGAIFAKAVCDYVAGCCSASDFAFDQVNCEGHTQVRFQAMVDSDLAGLTDYDEAAAGKCLEQLRAKKGCSATVFEFPCEEAIVGRLEDLQTCTTSSSCKSRWCSGDIDRVCRPLTSSAVAGVKAGDSCLDTCEAPGDCPPLGGDGPLPVCYRSEGLFCDQIGGGTCQTLRKIGQSCLQGRECSAGLFCQDTCTAPRVLGASCEADSECQSLACADEVCVESDFSESVCTAGGF